MFTCSIWEVSVHWPVRRSAVEAGSLDSGDDVDPINRASVGEIRYYLES